MGSLALTGLYAGSAGLTILKLPVVRPGTELLSVNTMRVGLETVDDHLAALATAAEAAKTITG
jgi:hypothetical protein